MGGYAALLMFLSVCLLLLAGFPAAFTLAGTALLFALGASALGALDLGLLNLLPQRVFGILTNETLIVVPLFILMGLILERSKVAEDLLDAMTKLFRGLPGGLALSATLVSTLLAASTGIVGATVVTLGLLCLPIMLKRDYDPALASGSIASAGTLGIIIPPSIMLILLAEVLSSAYQNVQIEKGVFALDTLSVGDLFAGALLPGFLISALYMFYQLGFALMNPSAAPPPKDSSAEKKPLALGHLIRVFITPILLILSVLGSILLGVATPTEAASLGAGGALLIAISRQKDGGALAYASALLLLFLLTAKVFFEPQLDFFAQPFFSALLSFLTIIAAALFILSLAASLYLLHRARLLGGILDSTGRITAMVFGILLAATLFSLVFRGLGGDEMARDLLADLPGGAVTAFLAVMLAMFLLGFVLDFLEITFIVVPVVAPILLAMDIHPIWLGVMMAINLQTSFLTPPFGFALFYLRGVAPPEISTSTIYRGVMPFVGLQILALILVGLFPETATFLPDFLKEMR